MNIMREAYLSTTQFASLFNPLSFFSLVPPVYPLLSALWWLEEVPALHELHKEERPQIIKMLISSLTGCLCPYPLLAAFDFKYYRESCELKFDRKGHVMLAERFVDMNDSECTVAP